MAKVTINIYNFAPTYLFTNNNNTNSIIKEVPKEQSFGTNYFFIVLYKFVCRYFLVLSKK